MSRFILCATAMIALSVGVASCGGGSGSPAPTFGSVTPPPAQTLAEAVQQELDSQLSEGVIKYESPATLRVGTTGVVSARVGYQTAEAIEQAVRTSGVVSGTSSIEVAPLMTAELYGAAFDVQPDTPREKHIPPGGSAEWTWTIRPNQSGDQLLILTVAAVVTTSDLGPQQAGDDFVATIKVRALPFSFSRWWGQNWNWIVGITAPLGAALGWWLKRRRKDVPLPPPSS